MADSIITDEYSAYNGDCVEVLRDLPPEVIDYSIFSPPFASLYTYSESDRDMGNCRNAEEFFEHFSFLVDELYRVMKPGRDLSFHCMNLPTSKVRHGYIGIDDFRGELIRAFQKIRVHLSLRGLHMERPSNGYAADKGNRTIVQATKEGLVHLSARYPRLSRDHA